MKKTSRRSYYLLYLALAFSVSLFYYYKDDTHHEDSSLSLEDLVQKYGYHLH